MLNLYHAFMLRSTITRKHTKICVFYVSWVVSDSQSFNKNILIRHLFILIYFLHIPLHRLVFYSLDYPLCLFPSYLNHAINISMKFVLLFISCIVYKLKNLQIKINMMHKLTAEHTLHSRIKFSIINCCQWRSQVELVG